MWEIFFISAGSSVPTPVITAKEERLCSSNKPLITTLYVRPSKARWDTEPKYREVPQYDNSTSKCSVGVWADLLKPIQFGTMETLETHDTKSGTS